MTTWPNAQITSEKMKQLYPHILQQWREGWTMAQIAQTACSGRERLEQQRQKLVSQIDAQRSPLLREQEAKQRIDKVQRELDKEREAQQLREREQAHQSASLRRELETLRCFVSCSRSNARNWNRAIGPSHNRLASSSTSTAM